TDVQGLDISLQNLGGRQGHFDLAAVGNGAWQWQQDSLDRHGSASDTRFATEVISPARPHCRRIMGISLDPNAALHWSVDLRDFFGQTCRCCASGVRQVSDIRPILFVVHDRPNRLMAAGGAYSQFSTRWARNGPLYALRPATARQAAETPAGMSTQANL